MTAAHPPGKVLIFSGPSGAGKTTVLKRVFERCPGPLTPSISATTRQPRPGEENGVDYYFLSRDEFLRRRANGDFLECCEVYQKGDWYGTLKEEVAPKLTAGLWVVLEIDVQGALAVLEHFPDAYTFFVRPESLDDLERRLRARGTEAEAVLQRRLEVARREMASADRYRWQILNRNVDEAVADICRILAETGAQTA